MPKKTAKYCKEAFVAAQTILCWRANEASSHADKALSAMQRSLVCPKKRIIYGQNKRRVPDSCTALRPQTSWFAECRGKSFLLSWRVF